MDRYDFIWKAIQKHGYKYDYRKINYINCSTKVCIICRKHGEFWQRPDLHIQKCGCRKCAGKLITSDCEFKHKLLDLYGNKYSYEKTEYVNARTKVTLTCPVHGEFSTLPSILLMGNGCAECNKIHTEEFIEKAKEVHGNKYDYSKVKYENTRTKICIICPEHGEFWQTPNKHLQGNGCPQCACKNNKSELKLKQYLERNINTTIIYQYKNHNLLGNFMSLDFYIPEYNIAIEYQGRQHFISISRFGGAEEFNKTTERDKIKFEKCKTNGIEIVYFTYDKRDIPKNYLNQIFTNKYDLINYIKRK